MPDSRIETSSFDNRQRFYGRSLLLISFFVTGCRSEQETSAPAMKETTLSAEKDSGTERVFDFEDCTPKSGVSFVYKNGEESGHFAILESLGGGVGILDFDLDHNDDLFFPGGGKFDERPYPIGVSAGLFRNLGDMRFSDASLNSSLRESSKYSHGASVADCDNDGFPDILVTGFGGLQLWKNLGDGTFTEAAISAGLCDSLWSSSAAWGDLNRDGALDLYIAHYANWSFENHPVCQGPQPGLREICPPRQYDGLRDSLYISNGDGTFRDGSTEWGLAEGGKGLGVIMADLDLDGDLDIYVTNDTVENFLYENQGDHLDDVSLISGSSVSEQGVAEGSMGVGVFDYNLDGSPDVWVVNYENESASLYENIGKLSFRHVSDRAGVTGAGLFVGWGTCCFDIDLNGFDDIFVSNGHVIRYPINAPVEQLPILLENLSGVRFRNVATAAGSYMTEVHKGRGAAISDLDNDGAVDLIVSNNNQPVRLLRNRTKRKGRWLEIELSGTTSSRDAVGAIVTLVSGHVRQVKQVVGGGSYASTNSRRIFFGIPADTALESVEVRWPSGNVQFIERPEVDQILRLIEVPSNHTRIGSKVE